jgi:hypothetical protein
MVANEGDFHQEGFNINFSKDGNINISKGDITTELFQYNMVLARLNTDKEKRRPHAVQLIDKLNRK